MRISRSLKSFKSFGSSGSSGPHGQFGNGVLMESGLKKFMSRVFLRSGAGVASTLGVALAVPLTSTNVWMLFGTGTVMAFGSIFAVGGLKPVFEVRNGYHQSTNPIGREIAFGGLTVGMGLTMAPFVSMIQSVDPIVLPASLIMTAGIFGGSAFVALKSSVDFVRWKGPLMVGLGCLIGTQLVGFASSLIAGPSSGLAMLLHNVDIYGGIGLFTLMTMYVPLLCLKAN